MVRWVVVGLLVVWIGFGYICLLVFDLFIYYLMFGFLLTCFVALIDY